MRRLVVAGTMLALAIPSRIQGSPANPEETLPERSAIRYQMAVAAGAGSHEDAKFATRWRTTPRVIGLMAYCDLRPPYTLETDLWKLAWAEGWKLGAQPDEPADQAIGAVYVSLYLRHRAPSMIAPLREAFDRILKRGPGESAAWADCDALFHAAPVWAGLTTATGNPAYLDYAVAQWWKTSEVIYDAGQHLFADRRSGQRTQTFGAAGNGRAIAGLVRLLQHVPAHHPARPRLEQQFRELAERIRACQRTDGGWHADLAAPARDLAPDVGATGLFCYALAWGLNQELLPAEPHLPAAHRAWRTLAQAFEKSRRQSAAGRGTDNESELSIGSFLLAGTEMHRLALLAANQTHTVTVRNPSAQHRALETVEIDLARLGTPDTPSPAEAQFVVVDGRSSRLVTSQRYDLDPGVSPRLLFQADLQPGEAQTFHVVPAKLFLSSTVGSGFTPNYPKPRFACDVTPAEGAPAGSGSSLELFFPDIGLWSEPESRFYYSSPESENRTWGPVRKVIDFHSRKWSAGNRVLERRERLVMEAGIVLHRIEVTFTQFRKQSWRSVRTNRIHTTLRRVPGVIPVALQYFYDPVADGVVRELPAANAFTYWEPARATTKRRAVISPGEASSVTEHKGRSYALLFPGATRTALLPRCDKVSVYSGIVGSQSPPVPVGPVVRTTAPLGKPLVYFAGSSGNQWATFADAPSWHSYVEALAQRLAQPAVVTVQRAGPRPVNVVSTP